MIVQRYLKSFLNVRKRREVDKTGQEHFVKLLKIWQRTFIELTLVAK